MALSYGGTAPHFSKSAAAYLFNEPLTTDDLSDIPEQDVREKVLMVS